MHRQVIFGTKSKNNPGVPLSRPSVQTNFPAYWREDFSFGLTPGVPLKEQGYPNGIPIEIVNFPGAKL